MKSPITDPQTLIKIALIKKLDQQFCEHNEKEFIKELKNLIKNFKPKKESE